MTRAFVLSGLTVLVVLAGCLGPSDDPGPAVGFDCASPFDDAALQLVEPDHDPLVGLSRENATVRELTDKRTCSLPAIGHNVLSPDGDPHHYLGEIDMRGDLDLGAVAVLGNQEGAKVYLVDIEDRANPTVVAEIFEYNTYIVDVKISDDGALLFTASQTLPLTPELDGLPALNAPTGFTVYDISDPAAPRYLTFVQDTGYGCHMMSHEIVGGVDVLFCISQNVRAYRLERVGDTVVDLGFVEYLATNEMGLPQYGEPPVDPIGIPGEVKYGLFANGPHDITVQVDPVTGQTLGIVSHWNEGVRIIDLSALPQITELGKWLGEGATHYHGNVHTAMMFYVGEQRYIMASPEYTFDGAVPGLWVLDATDLSDLKLVAQWYHPGEHVSQSLFLTTHQWQVAPTGPGVNASDVRVYLTMNHGGLWVLDFGQILAGDAQAAILGFNLARPALVDNPVNNAILNTWDVNVVDGYIYGSDRGTGLWVFHYTGDVLGDDRLRGFA